MGGGGVRGAGTSMSDNSLVFPPAWEQEEDGRQGAGSCIEEPQDVEDNSADRMYFLHFCW